MTTNDNKNFGDFSDNFECSLCYVTCSCRSEWNRHVKTKKHNNNKMTTQISAISAISANLNNSKFDCMCGKKYSDRVCLWRHKKKCIFEPQQTTQGLGNYENGSDGFLTNMIIDILKINNDLQKQNSVFQQQMIDMCKNGIMYNSNNTITNSNNKTFNLNVFLNEECKDAMNIMEFVDSLQLQLSDLETVGRLGFVNGISDIIIKNLKALDIHKRPVHCTDLKREVIYVKDENQWEKEAENNNKIRRAIKCIAQKNTKSLSLFKQKHPDCLQGDSRSSNQYNKLTREAFGGGSDKDDTSSENKIISRLSKEVTIDKII